MKDISFSKKSTMMDNFVIDGVWYLNDMQIEDGIFGQLSYKPNEITLKLMGKFADKYHTKDIKVSDIYGFSISGKYIHLQNCLIIKQQDNFPGMSIEYYNIQIFFVSDSEIKKELTENISNFTVSFKDYENWNISSPIQILQVPNNEMISIQYSKKKFKEMQQIFYLNNMNLKLVEVGNIKNDFNKSNSEINVTQQKFLFVEPLDKSILSFEKFLEYLNVINQMFSL